MCLQLFSLQTTPKQTDTILETFAGSATNFFPWQLKIQGLNEEKESI